MRQRLLLVLCLLFLVGCVPEPQADHFDPIAFARPPLPAEVADWAEDHVTRPGVWIRTYEGQTYVVASWGIKDHPGDYKVTISALERMPDDTLVVEIDLTYQAATDAPSSPPTDFVAFDSFVPKGFLVRFADTGKSE